ncbi:hypothetical protein MIND_00252200 [Mycena indigotica]|uniref:Actin-like ATPase domain-containing protein n=1 Tax=Mycena indigotica TaxID=2126181 RepID=A0A8H6WB96_9AGAR|nr:uncharacterized protein MIND_00252200 [Mycena indigotica]KAF7312389.1 hypothetical protein MIND_00252200 [Mycena indigotica]
MKASLDSRRPYNGPTRSIVIAIDVGTTFSGVSRLDWPSAICRLISFIGIIFHPRAWRNSQNIWRHKASASQFPGQEHVAGNSKIPSLLWYDSHGKMAAAGAEAEALTAQAEDEGWTKVDLFKLRLRPRSMHLNMNGMRLGRLPLGKTPVHVLGDFLAYLFTCTRNFIVDTHANGSALWASVESDIKFVLSHPNGWEGAQQSKFRRAAIQGGLVPSTDEGKSRIFFVTEGEASLHACVLNGLAAEVLSDPSKPGFLIADAGGGTWDISAYSITGNQPLQIEELAPSDCIFAGSVFVSRRARRFLEEKLKHSKYGSPEAVEHITKRFDETTKRLFRDDQSLQFISFGSPLDKDSSVGIRGGKLKLTGEEVRDLFEPSIEAAFEAIKAQVDASAGVIKSVWLVGGFAANHWLFNQLQERLAPYGVTVNRPDSQTSKAVCDGSVGFYVDHHVSVRMSKAFYGVEYLRAFDPEDAEHASRESTLVELPSGPRLLPDAFDCILKQGIKVKESTVFSRKYSTELTSLNVLSVFEVLIWCYRGKGEVPMWIYRDADEFSTLCMVRADLSPLKSSAVAQEGKNGTTFWKIVFSIEIHFGLTEFRARIKWLDNGEVKYGPASIIYNERGRRVEEEEPDVFSEDDMTIASARSERVRSPPSLSRPPSSAALRSPALAPPPPPPPAPFTESPKPPTPGPSVTEREVIPDVARLPQEQQPAEVGSGTGTSERGSADREPSRGRKSSKAKGKEKEKDKEREKKGKEKDLRHEESVMSRSSSKLADELTSVWGKGKDASKSPPTQSRGFDAPETVVEETVQPPPVDEVPPAATTPKLPPADITEPPPAADTPKSPKPAEQAVDEPPKVDESQQQPVAEAVLEPAAVPAATETKPETGEAQVEGAPVVESQPEPPATTLETEAKQKSETPPADVPKSPKPAEQVVDEPPKVDEAQPKPVEEVVPEPPPIVGTETKPETGGNTVEEAPVVQSQPEPAADPVPPAAATTEQPSSQPTVEQSSDQPAADQPSTDQSTAEPATTEQPAPEPAAVEPTATEPPVAEQPAVEQPAVEQQVATKPAATEQPVIEQPPAEPAAEVTATEPPVVEPAAVEQAPEQPAMEQPAPEPTHSAPIPAESPKTPVVGSVVEKDLPPPPPEETAKEEPKKDKEASQPPTPVARSKPLVEILTSFAATKLTPGLQHLALPEQIPLPLSSAGSPISARTPRAHGSPLTPFDNNLGWQAESGDQLFKAPSRAPSVAPSPSLKSSLSLHLGSGAEESASTGSSATPAKSTLTKNQRKNQKRRKGSAAADGGESK